MKSPFLKDGNTRRHLNNECVFKYVTSSKLKRFKWQWVGDWLYGLVQHLFTGALGKSQHTKIATQATAVESDTIPDSEHLGELIHLA